MLYYRLLSVLVKVFRSLNNNLTNQSTKYCLIFTPPSTVNTFANTAEKKTTVNTALDRTLFEKVAAAGAMWILRTAEQNLTLWD